MGGDWVEDLIQDMTRIQAGLARIEARLDQIEAEISLLDIVQEEE